MISIPSHNAHIDFRMNGGVDGSVIESIDGESVVLRAAGALLATVALGGAPLEHDGRTLTFTPATDGLHELAITFADGKRRTLSIVRVGERWLHRIGLRPGGVTSRAQFREKARLIIRSILRHRIADSGQVPELLSFSDFGSYSGPDALRYGDFL